MQRNEFDQPIGDPVTWSARPKVAPVRLAGPRCTIEPYDERHLDGLVAALVTDASPRIWTYIPVEEMTGREPLRQWLASLVEDPGAVPHTLCLPEGRPVGVASYLRLDETNGSVEVGGIVYAEELQRTAAATEAMYLMARHVFEDLGYRRYEWKCDAHNLPSRRAAERLGFTYEGTFRNALVYKGRNRDSDWLSITDAEWPMVRAALERWLAPSNFDDSGRQIERLRVRGGNDAGPADVRSALA